MPTPPGPCSAAVLSVALTDHPVGSAVPVRQSLPVSWVPVPEGTARQATAYVWFAARVRPGRVAEPIVVSALPTRDAMLAALSEVSVADLAAALTP